MMTTFVFVLLMLFSTTAMAVDCDLGNPAPLLFVTYDEEDMPRVHTVEHLGDEIAAMDRMGVIVESMIGSEYLTVQQATAADGTACRAACWGKP